MLVSTAQRRVVLEALISLVSFAKTLYVVHARSRSRLFFVKFVKPGCFCDHASRVELINESA